MIWTFVKNSLQSMKLLDLLNKKIGKDEYHWSITFYKFLLAELEFEKKRQFWFQNTKVSWHIKTWSVLFLFKKNS